MISRKVFSAKHLTRTALALAIGVGVVGIASGQETTGSIFGQAPSGDTVVIKSTSGLTRTITVDQDGRYSANALPVGSYVVTLQRGGEVVDKRSNVSLRVGSGTEVSFNGAGGEANAQSLSGLTVTASALPDIDVSSVDSRTVITSDQLKTLPIARNAEAIALLAPGAVSGSSAFTGPTGQQLVSFGGASVTENAYYINGMNVTDPLNGLGGIELPYNSIEQEQVLTGGYGAAYGRSDGGVINMVGKRGTNEWHFGGQIQYTPKFGRADPVNQYYSTHDHAGSQAGNLYSYRHANKSWAVEESGYIGGPLIKDKLFAFISAEAERSSGQSVSSKSSSATATNYEYHDPKYYAKFDWNINDNNILELTGASTTHSYSGNIYGYDYDTYSEDGFLHPDTHTKTSAKMWIAKYTGYLTDSLTVTAQLGKQKTRLYQEIADFDPTLTAILGSANQNPAYTNGTPITNSQTVLSRSDPNHQDKAMNYRFDVSYVLGSHTITAGIDNQRTQDIDDNSVIAANSGYAWDYAQAQNPNANLQDGVDAPAGYPGGAQGYYVTKYDVATNATVRVDQRAQYIQDAWQVTDRLLLNIGLRNDQFTNYNNDGQPYIRLTKPQWQPRLGFSWDVYGDSSFKVYGNVGRYYLSLPTSVALRGANGSSYFQTYYTYTGIDPATGYPTGLHPINTSNGPGVPYAIGGEDGSSPDPQTVAASNLKAQYQDEYILGFDKALNMFSQKWTYGAKFTYRKLRTVTDDTCDLPLLTDDLGPAQGLDVTSSRQCRFFNPGQATDFVVNTTDGLQTIHATAKQLGFPKPKRGYYGLNLYLNHPFDGTWWGRIDYLFSRSYGNSEGQVNSILSQSDIAATQDWDWPSVMEWSNGVLSNDRKHQIKIRGGYQIDPQWSVSGVVVLASGTPRSCLGFYGASQSNLPPDNRGWAGANYHYCNGLPSPPGAVGRTPWEHTYSFNVEYRPAFADHKLALGLYMFNILNEQNATRYETSNASTTYGMPLAFETPRYIRFSASYDF